MLDLIKSDNCTGCMACYNICPKLAISMKNEMDGFLFPQINSSLCIECGACEKACPVYHSHIQGSGKSKYYSFTHPVYEKLVSSASGGAFSFIAELFITKRKGVVYGCALDNNFCHHVRITTIVELEKLKDSKYIQSYIGDIYKNVKEDLTKGLQVLFSGTPCQISGLLGFLGKKHYENLFTIDLICHGVASPLVWQKYVDTLSKHFNGEIENFHFKDKFTGWGGYSISFECNHEKYHERAGDNIYMQGYGAALFHRLSCYDCQMKGANLSDITLGDFWGVEITNPDVFNEKGVSAIIVNTPQGENIFEDFGLQKLSKLVLKKDVVDYNPFYVRSVEYNKNRTKFVRHFNQNKELEGLIIKYLKRPLWIRIKTVIYNLIYGGKND